MPTIMKELRAVSGDVLWLLWNEPLALVSMTLFNSVPARALERLRKARP